MGRAAFDAALLEHGEATLLFDPQGVCTFANPAARDALRLAETPVGIPAAEIAGLDTPELLAAIAPGAGHRRGTGLECRSDVDGRPMRIRVVGLGGASAVYLRDVEREVALEREAERARRELDVARVAAASGSFAWDLATGAVRVSEEALSIHGIDRSMGWVWQESVASLVHPEDRATHGALIDQVLAHPGQPVTGSYRILRADTGEVRVLRGAAELLRGTDGHPDLMVGSLTDVTDEMAARDALAESEERLRRTLEGVDAIISYQEDGASPVVLNAAVNRILGYPPASFARHGRWGELLHPHDLQACLQVWETSPTWDLVYRMRRADGAWIWVADRGHRIERQANGDGMFSVVVDVTERVEADLARQRTEARYRAVMENAVDAILIADVDGRIVSANRGLERSFGWQREALRGQSFRRLFAVDDADRIAAWSDDFLAGCVDVADGVLFELEAVRADGSRFPAEVSVAAWSEGDERYFAGMVRDISDRRAAEAAAQELQGRLAQSQRLEALGQLAGGVAHDMNNILAAIQGYASFAEAAVSPSSPASDDLRQVLAATDRASSLTRQLLAFSRQQRTEPVAVDIRSVVDGLAPMLRRLLGEHIDIRIDHAADLGPIVADPGQIEQVVVNLAVNARDAMPDGGILRVETANLDGMPLLGRTEPFDTVRLTVSDTGVGMDAAIRARIFEPFFTTKPVGKGTGLGLATVYGIVQAAGGAITVTSAPGLGTTFAIDFPRSASAPDEPASPAPRAAPQPEGERVLLVEDDPAVREVLRRSLTGLGYQCVASGDGDAALEVLVRRDFVPDVLVTDVRMPGIQGPDLVRRSRALIPGLPVVLLTGYAGDLTDEVAVLEASGRVEVATKPIRGQALGTLIERVAAA